MNRKMALSLIEVTLLLVLVGTGTYYLGARGVKETPDSPVRVACVGDSITAASGYPFNLGLLLGSNYVVGNFGDSGAAVSLNSNDPYLRTPTFHVATQFQPNIVIIMLGTNDAHVELNDANATFIDDYTELITDFQALASKPKVWIVKPPPIFNNDLNLSVECYEQNIAPRIEQVANEADVPVIDVFSTLINHPDYFYDGIHPDIDGTNIIASSIYNAIFSEENP